MRVGNPCETYSYACLRLVQTSPSTHALHGPSAARELKLVTTEAEPELRAAKAVAMLSAHDAFGD